MKGGHRHGWRGGELEENGGGEPLEEQVLEGGQIQENDGRL